MRLIQLPAGLSSVQTIVSAFIQKCNKRMFHRQFCVNETSTLCTKTSTILLSSAVNYDIQLLKTSRPSSALAVDESALSGSAAGGD